MRFPCYHCKSRRDELAKGDVYMAETSGACPICGEQLEPEMGECPRCGFKLIGETQAFTPLDGSPAVAGSPAGSGVVPALEVLKGPYAGECFRMGLGDFTIGRDPSCDLFLSNMTVSRHHATIHVADDGASIRDEGSLNGTWVDGKVVEQAPLAVGTHVQIGTFDMVYVHLAEQGGVA